MKNTSVHNKNIKAKSKRNRKSISGKLPPFVALTWQMLNSEAYKKLSFSAAKILPYFLGKPHTNQAYHEFHLIDFTFSYKEARSYGFAQKTFARCIEQLMQKGFIDPVSKGGLRGDGKAANRFKNSQRWLSYGHNDFTSISWRQFVQRNAF